MPWKDTSIESERLQFIERPLRERRLSLIVSRSGISRKTGYKIIGRYRMVRTVYLTWPLLTAIPTPLP